MVVHLSSHPDRRAIWRFVLFTHLSFLPWMPVERGTAMSLSNAHLVAKSKDLIKYSEELSRRLGELSDRSVKAQTAVVKLHACVVRMRPSTCRGEILIVDDNSDTCDLLTGLLHRHGYSVRHVPDKDAALDAIRQWPASTILMDYRTPGLDAGGFVRILKAAHPKVVIILMSAMPDLSDLALSLGLRFIATKPVNFDRLLVVVAQAEWLGNG